MPSTALIPPSPGRDTVPSPSKQRLVTIDLPPSQENARPRNITSPLTDDGMRSPQSDTSRTSMLSPLYTPGDTGVSPSPFNFTPMTLPKSPVSMSSVGQRRGHKYKHSSVSHAIFQEPTQRAPFSLPNSLPIPTFLECRKSMSREQTTRLWWSICHALVAAYTLWSASGSLAQTALSHLILFDALGAMLCVAVDVLGNFEVWRRSSVRHPFGLQRAEVLAGFATSVLLVFMGFDLISHNVTHMLEGLGGHEPHYEHEHGPQRVSAGEVDLVSLMAMISTVISAVVLKNHARVGKVMRLAIFDSLPSILSNPSHFLTLTCSALLLLLPLLSIEMFTWMDRALSCTVAVAMCVFGGRLLFMLGPILLMSYASPAVHTVLQDIESDPLVTRIEEARFWQVHYGLCMANLKLRVRGTEDNVARLRERLASLIKNRLGGGYGSGGQRWEVSTQLAVDSD